MTQSNATNMNFMLMVTWHERAETMAQSAEPNTRASGNIARRFMASISEDRSRA